MLGPRSLRTRTRGGSHHPPQSRMRALAVALLLGAVLMPAATAAPVAATISTYLAVPKVKQSQSQWCTMGANQSIVRFLYGFTYAQCEQANDSFNLTSCCINPTSSSCNKGRHLEVVRDTNLERYGIGGTVRSGTLTWSELSSEITTHERPFMVHINWLDGNGNAYAAHVWVVRGRYYHDGSNYRSVSVMDPGDGLYKSYEWGFFNNNSGFDWVRTLWRYD
jgi:hypothetical protein